MINFGKTKMLKCCKMIFHQSKLCKMYIDANCAKGVTCSKPWDFSAVFREIYRSCSPL